MEHELFTEKQIEKFNIDYINHNIAQKTEYLSLSTCKKNFSIALSAIFLIATPVTYLNIDNGHTTTDLKIKLDSEPLRAYARSLLQIKLRLSSIFVALMLNIAPYSCLINGRCQASWRFFKSLLGFYSPLLAAKLKILV